MRAFGRPTSQQRQLNRAMTKMRISVEWGLGQVQQQFCHLGQGKSQKIMLRPVAKLFRVGVILTNCHTCTHGNVTSAYLGCAAPSVEGHLRV